MTFVLLILSLISTANATVASEFTLTEKSLLNLAKENNPSLDEIQSQFLSSQAKAMELNDKFGLEAYAGYNKIDTNEKSFIPFQPIFTNVNQYTVGVKKYSKYGMVLDVHAAVDQRSGQAASGSDYKDIHTTIYEVGFQVDLWRDLFGKISRKQVSSLEKLKKKDELQSKISKDAFHTNVRRVYWTLVANAEKLKINNNLYQMALNQLKDVKRRKANSISDSAEVARFESLVHTRKGQVLLLEYERENLFKSLREMFPSLNGKNILLKKYSIDDSVNEVLACSAKIGGTQQVPYDFTLYDEVVSFLKEIESNQKTVDNSYDDIDLKLDLKLSQIGVSSETDDTVNYYGDYNDSIQDIRDNDRKSMQAGLMLTIPFGKGKSDTSKIKEKVTEGQFRANIQRLDSQMSSTHIQVKETVKLLAKLIQAQKKNSKALGIRVREMKKKYNQARIPEYALIQDQDSLLKSDLNVVNTQLQVVNTLLDYISVFNTFPCQFNRNL